MDILIPNYILMTLAHLLEEIIVLGNVPSNSFYA